MEITKDFVCHGDILYAVNAEKLEVFEDSWIVVTDGRVEGYMKSCRRNSFICL